MYKTSSELKKVAKDSLKGRWGEAIKLSLVPILLQLISIFIITLAIAGFYYFVTEYSSTANEISEFGESSYDSIGESSPGFSFIIEPILSFVGIFITLGISFTFLDMIRKETTGPVGVKDAFRLFNGQDFVPIFLINLLINIFTSLWSLVFIIPGIVKTYSYSQANFIYKDLTTHKDTRSMPVTSFITESRELIRGHKGRLFWLDLTFIGWWLLVPFTFGLILIYLIPYTAATKAAFYDDLSKGKFLKQEEVYDDIDEGEWTNF